MLRPTRLRRHRTDPSFSRHLAKIAPWIWPCTSAPRTKLAPPRRSAPAGGFSTMGILTSISTAFHKGGWGMWPILITSIFTIAVIVERAVYLFKPSVDKDKLLALLKTQVI